MIYLYYDNRGKIISTYTGFNISAQKTRLPYIESEVAIDTKLYYILNKTVTKRPISEVIIDKQTLIADGIDLITFSNVVKGMFSAINITTGETIKGEIEGSDTFSTTVVGTYKVKIESFPYLDFETTIEAV